MRKFIDLNIKNPGNQEDLKEMMRLASKMGFEVIGISSEDPITQDLKNHAKTIGINIASRIDLKPEKPKDLTKALRKTRRRFDIVAVKCNSKAILRQAAKDQRIDILNFKLHDRKNRIGFDHQGASLAAKSNCVYEYIFDEIIRSTSFDQVQTIFNMRKDFLNASREGVPIIVTSGASKCLQMREPRALASLTSLIGMSETKGLDTVSMQPQRILDRNREKLNSGYIQPGVMEIK
jgi:RNase P/RNase MRP subunit p30